MPSRSLLARALATIAVVAVVIVVGEEGLRGHVEVLYGFVLLVIIVANIDPYRRR